MRSRRWTGSSVTVVERRSSIRGPLRTAISRRGESSIGSAAGRRSPLDGSGAAGVTPAVDYDGPAGRSGGMADAAVSNTAGGNLIRVRIPASAPRWPEQGSGDLVGGQAEPELGAAARPALGPHPAAHPGDEVAAHEQPDPGSRGLVGHGRGPEEQVEQAARLGLVDPGALVEDGNLRFGAAVGDPDLDRDDAGIRA